MVLKEKVYSDHRAEFLFNSGWFKWFKNHYSLFNVKVSGVSVDHIGKLAEKFSETWIS